MIQKNVAAWHQVRRTPTEGTTTMNADSARKAYIAADAHEFWRHYISVMCVISIFRVLVINFCLCFKPAYLVDGMRASAHCASCRLQLKFAAMSAIVTLATKLGGGGL